MYKECFSDILWVSNFGFNQVSFDLNKYLEESVLTVYPTVKRIILLNKEDYPLAFSHLCFNEHNCVVVGGIIPPLLNKGKGVTLAAIVYDYLFRYHPKLRKVTITVLVSNSPSLRMNIKLGFKISGRSTISDVGEKHTMVLLRDAFPNQFARDLLERVEYEVC